jgi:hypothetical protein
MHRCVVRRVPRNLAALAIRSEQHQVPLNGHPEGAPFEHYGPLQSGEALRHASEISELVSAQAANP